MPVLHPLFVHLHIATFLMAFLATFYWFFKGLASSLFEDRIFRFARANTTFGLLFLIASMAAGMRDALGHHDFFAHSPLGAWLNAKVGLSFFALFVYGLYWFKTRKKRHHVEEELPLLFWSIGLQLLGFFLIVGITVIGTLLVYAPEILVAGEETMHPLFH